jgi:DNA ligase (NAD+)
VRDQTSDPSARVDELRHLIDQHNYSYWVQNSPTISDGEYDALIRELRELEHQHPELQSDVSPSVRVGGEIGQGFRPRRHPVPMLSLANATSHEAVRAWLLRARNIAGDARVDFVCEPKIDGLAIALTYENGTFQIGATRGNGIEGEDVTRNLRTVKDVPDRLKGDSVPEVVEVRGEIYMSIDGFEELNQRRAEAGESLFANPRNSAAGSLRQLDSAITARRPLHLFAYQIGYADGLRIGSQWEALNLLREWGFPVNPVVRHVETVEEVEAYCDGMAEERERLAYETDGVVIKISSIALQEELGEVGRDPRWAIAYKFAPREATTRLLDIQVNVGRTGAINPFAVLEPVNVGGVTLKLATLHNEDDIHRKDVRIGDRVIVRRAGDVIPQVVKPIVEERDGSQTIYQLPKKCPACGTEIVRPVGEAMARCPNLECPAQRYRWIEHFVSQGAMDIRGLGEAIVQLLIEKDLIRDPADMYLLTLDEFLTLPKIKEKTASNLMRAIQRSKRRPLHNVIFALGIRYVGYQTAELLADALGDLDVLLDAPAEHLESIEGVGGKTAESVAEWARRPQSRAFTDRLKAAGVTWREVRSHESQTGPLTGATMLITGSLDSLRRGAAERSLRELGAKIAPGVSKSVDYLIVGADPGSKLDKARKLGTPTRDEAWLLRVLEEKSLPE